MYAALIDLVASIFCAAGDVAQDHGAGLSFSLVMRLIAGIRLLRWTRSPTLATLIVSSREAMSRRISELLLKASRIAKSSGIGMQKRSKNPEAA
jgi:hypothetical protein